MAAIPDPSSLPPDFTVVLKAAQSLSSTIQRDELLHQLAAIILQHSGTERFIMMVPNQVGQWQVQIVATADEIDLNLVPLAQYSELPQLLIQYVQETQEMVLLDQLNTDLPVIDDYLRQYQPHSILCLPILYQGRLRSVVYLKHRTAHGIFTSDRILILNFLCTQAVISLENARLHTQEQEKFQQLKEKNHLLAFQSIISHIAARNDDLAAMLQQFCQAMVVYLQAAFGRIWLLRPEENVLELKASAGLYTHINGDHQFVPVGKFKIGLIAEERTPHLTNDVLNDPRVGNPEWARQQGMIAFAGYPLMIRGELLGVVAMFSRLPLSDSILASLDVVATEIALGVQRKLLEASVEQKAASLEQTLQELRTAQLQMVQNEKMASLGNLVAGVAHEINNPLGFLNGSVDHAKDYIQDLFDYIALYQQYHPDAAEPVREKADEIDLEFLQADLPKLLKSMEGATERIRSISISLRTFSRADTEHKVTANLHEGIDSTLLILKYRLKADEHRPAIDIIQDYDELPLIECFPGQLNQVFMNLLANAIDVFDEMAKNDKVTSPQITIRTASLGNQVQISIQDNGEGMTEEVRAKIFDSLFTTKEVGKGTGLGLAIAQQIIVEKHNGTIIVNSEVGKGTEFVMTLPLV
jgi:signal transduction histidine kinase